MTLIEHAIKRGLKNTFKLYERMTDYWLSHAPEYFVTVGIAQTIHKDTEGGVFMDVSLKRIYSHRKSQGEASIRGKPPFYLSNRPDISVWYKSSPRVKAAIEIKKAYSLDPVKKDVARLRRIVGKPHGPKVGYVVAYSETKPRKSKSTSDSLSARFDKWEKSTKTKLIIKGLGKKSDDSGWWHGWCVLRVDE